ncbi:hypothetical protein LINPERHAP2_LOCUS22786 [Linum perenne]
MDTVVDLSLFLLKTTMVDPAPTKLGQLLQPTSSFMWKSVWRAILAVKLSSSTPHPTYIPDATSRGISSTLCPLCMALGSSLAISTQWVYRSKFTWFRGLLRELLDRSLCDDRWLKAFPHSTIFHLERIKSDH